MNRYDILLNKKFERKPLDIIKSQDYLDCIDKSGFRQESQGVFVKPTCSVIDLTGNCCPGKPEHFFVHCGKDVGLCDMCYINYKEGIFDSHRQRKDYGCLVYQFKEGRSNK